MTVSKGMFLVSLDLPPNKMSRLTMRYMSLNIEKQREGVRQPVEASRNLHEYLIREVVHFLIIIAFGPSNNIYQLVAHSTATWDKHIGRR